MSAPEKFIPCKVCGQWPEYWKHPPFPIQEVRMVFGDVDEGKEPYHDYQPKRSSP